MNLNENLPDVLKQASRVITSPLDKAASDWELTHYGGVFRDSIVEIEDPFEDIKPGMVFANRETCIRILYILSFPYNTFKECYIAFANMNAKMKKDWIEDVKPVVARNILALMIAMEHLIPTATPDHIADMLILLACIPDTSNTTFIGTLIMRKVDTFDKKDGERFLDMFTSILRMVANSLFFLREPMTEIAGLYQHGPVLCMALYEKWSNPAISFRRFLNNAFVEEIFGSFDYMHEDVMKMYCHMKEIRPPSMRPPAAALSQNSDSSGGSGPDDGSEDGPEDEPDNGSDSGPGSLFDDDIGAIPGAESCSESSSESYDPPAKRIRMQLDRPSSEPPQRLRSIEGRPVHVHPAFNDERIFIGLAFEPDDNGIIEPYKKIDERASCRLVCGSRSRWLAVCDVAKTHGIELDHSYPTKGTVRITEKVPGQFKELAKKKSFLCLGEFEKFKMTRFTLSTENQEKAFTDYVSLEPVKFRYYEIFDDTFELLQTCLA